MTRIFPFLAVLALLIAPLGLLASQDLNYGLGGSTSGRVSGVTAEVDNPFAALYNPALLAAQPTALFAFSVSSAGASFSPMKGVLVDSKRFRTSRGVAPLTRDFQLPDTQTTLWATGLTYPIRRIFGTRAGLGVVVSGPYNRLRTFSSGTPYDFAELRYGGSDSQFKATLGSSLEILSDHLFLGAGISLFMTSSGAAEAALVSDNPTGRLALDVGLNTAALAGVFGKFGDNQASLVFRQAIDPKFQQTIEPKVQFAGEEIVHQPLLLQASLYYEPALVEFDWQRDFGAIKGSVGVSYQIWAGYEPPYLNIQTPSREGTKRTRLPALSLNNSWNPRVSAELPLFQRKAAVSVGYQYRPSPVGDISGAGNMLDSDAHVVGLSFRHRVGAGELLPFSFEWGVFGQYHFLTARRVNKTASDFIGAPGYEFSGRAYTYGVSFQAPL